MKSYIVCACFVAFLSCCMTEVKAGGVAILGGYTEVWTADSTSMIGTQNHWGQSAASGTDEDWDIMSAMCWVQTNTNCYMKLIVNTDPAEGQEQYEILGSKLVVMNAQSTAIDREMYNWSSNQIYKAGDVGEKITAFASFTWSPGYDDWGYGYLYFYVQKVTRAPMTIAFSKQAHNAGGEQYTTEERFSGSKTSDSIRNKLGFFRCWTENWWQDSVRYIYMWTVPTELVSYNPRYEDREILSIADVPRVMTYVLENNSGEPTHDGLPAIEKSEDVTVSSTSTFTSTFDFAWDLGYEIGFDVFAVSSSVATSVHFGFSKTEELSQTDTTEVTDTIKWPAKCDAGFRCTYQVVEKSDTQSIPVDFVYAREGSQWMETRDMVAKTHYLENYADDCCLHDYASDLCGSDQLPMCDTL